MAILFFHRFDPRDSSHGATLQHLLEAAPSYALTVEGKPTSPTAGYELLHDLPPGKTADDKFVFGIFIRSELVGVADLIRGYPTPEVAYVGLLLFDETHQGHGYGVAAIEQIDEIAASWGCTFLRLGVIETNTKAVAFWRRMGFEEVERKTMAGFTGDAIVMARAVRPPRIERQVIVLVGPKGAGKSTIGDFLAKELGIHFLRVEPLFLEVRSRLGASHPDYERLGFESVIARLIESLSDHDIVCFESTGASPWLAWQLERLSEVARVLLVRVIAEPEQCLDRIRSRDLSIHIPVSDDQVERINEIARRVELPWAAEIDNRGAFDGARIIDSIRRITEPPAAGSRASGSARPRPHPSPSAGS